MRSVYVASWMLAVVVLVAILAASPASGQNSQFKTPNMVKKNPIEKLNANPANVNQVSDSVTNLAQKIARSIASPKSKTEIFSPVSIAGALSLLLLGAGGQTRNELMSVMGLGDGQLSFQAIHYAFGRLFQDLVANDPTLVPLVTWRVNDKCNRYDEDYEDDEFPPMNTTANTFPSHLISVVNGMFLQNSLKPANRFLAVLKGFYKSTVVQNLDFQRDPSSAASYINDWCARETNGKIKEMVTAQMVANSRMIVASALYFKAQWETTFSPYGTRPRPFYLNGRQEPPIDVETMATTGCFPYFDATPYGAQIIGLPYETNKSTMYIVVPTNSTRQGLQRLQASLGAAQLNWMIDQMKTKKGMVVLPKLSISNRIQLSSVLQQLGVRDLFDPSRSDLSQVLDETSPQTETQQAAAIPTVPPKSINKTVESRFDSAPVASGVRPQGNQQHQQMTTPNTPKKPFSQQPQATPRPQLPKQQQAQPADTYLQTMPFDFNSNDCNQVENCRYTTQCICTIIPTTEDATDCGKHVASFTSIPYGKNCQFSFESKQLGRISLCVKQSYRKETQLRTNQACIQNGCVFYDKQCYCCQGNKRPASNMQVGQTAQPVRVTGFAGNPAQVQWVYVVRYYEYSPESAERHICLSVPSLNSEHLCGLYRYRWMHNEGVCIDEATCQPSYQRSKREAQYGQGTVSRNTQQQQDYQQHQQQQQKEQQELPQQHNQQHQLQQGGIQNSPQESPLPNGQQLQTNLQYQQQSSASVPPRQSSVPLFVNDIITQVKLDVNEQGTEGGAVTLALIDRIGPGYTFQVDGPFLIFIRHDNTNALLFYGAVYDPRP